MLSKLAHLAGAVLVALTLTAMAPKAAAGAVTLPARANPIPAPSGGCLLGAYVHDNPDQTVFNSGAGKDHALLLKFIHMGVDGFDVAGPISARAFCDSAYALDAVPYLTIEPDHATADSVLTAEDREWLIAFAKELGAYQRPAFVRFGHEMNGNWYPWGWTHVEPAVYIEGFREAAAIFREHAPLVAMVWAPSQNWGNNCTELYSTWYPGDEYVDWVGLTSYEWSYGGVMDGQFYYSIKFGDGPEANFYATFAEGHNKPMMIAETACGDDDPAYYARQEQIDTFGTGVGQGAQNWWIARVYDASDDYYSTKVNFPKIGAITWFGKGDWAPGGSDLTLHSTGFSAYATAVEDSYWRSNAMLPPETVVEGVPVGWSRSDVAVSFSVPRPGSSGGTRTFYGIDAPATAEWTAPVAISAEGTSTLYYRSVGRAGAWEETRSAQVRIDKTPPVTTDNHASYYPAQAVIGLTSIDSLSGVSEIRYQLDGGAVATGDAVSVSDAGTHTLVYQAIDGAGNVEGPKTAVFVVREASGSDIVPPTTTCDAAATYVATARINFTATDDKSGVRATYYRLDGAPALAGTTVTTSALGDHVLQYWSVDNVGNLEAAKTVRFAVVKPKVALGRPKAPRTMKRGRFYFVYGTLKPHHERGSMPVRIYKYKKVNAKSWKSYGYVKATAVDYKGLTRYRVRMRLPSKGSWRLRAYAPSDAKHAATRSGYEYVLVK
ncbi:MAG TPA: glycosyl hydrolase [Coriobacteriia bacterium]|nr:glycosyl hydrolase [Coriobacteriia bacterium]